MSIVSHVNPASLRVPTKAYSNGVVVCLGDVEMMFVTGQLSQDVDGQVLFPDNAEEQARQIFKRLEIILAEAKMSLDNVVKAQIFVTRIADVPAVTKVRDEAFKVSRPASTLLEVGAMVKPGCCVEIEVIAVRPVE